MRRRPLAALLATALSLPLAAPGAAAERRERPVLELPAPACDVCAPGQPPPPEAVQEQLRRINEHANWRKRASTGDTIPLGSATRVWLQRAWASGRLQPGVASIGGGGGPAGGVAARQGALRQQPRTSLASRSRTSLADRRSTRDRGRSARRGAEAASTPSASSFGTGSQLGTGRSTSRFGSMNPRIESFSNP